jgi:hypothetical protein
LAQGYGALGAILHDSAINHLANAQFLEHPRDKTKVIQDLTVIAWWHGLSCCAEEILHPATNRPRAWRYAECRFYTSRVICQGQLTMEEIIFSLKHYWRFIDCEDLELKALS